MFLRNVSSLLSDNAVSQCMFVTQAMENNIFILSLIFVYHVDLHDRR
jgi:hypothetical protein